MSNIERWVQRVEGVAFVHTDLNTGTAQVWFKAKQRPDPAAMWKAVEDVGYEPTKIVIGQEVYKGPKR